MKSTALRKSRSVAVIVCVLSLAAFTTLSFTMKNVAGDIWKQLGMAEQQAKEDINYSFFSGYLHYYGAREIKNISVGDRAAIAGDVLAYVKQYVSTPAFENQYLKNRDAEKAKIYPVVPAITRDELVKKRITDAEASKKTIEDLLKTTTDQSVIKSYKEQIEFWKKSIEDYKSPNSTQISYDLQADANRYKTEKDTYDQLMKKWETNYPASVKQFIKQRLSDFLDATKDIDYKAALVDKPYKKVFANPVYEKKNWKWKMGYRAGKEATEAAREFAQNWVKEL
jgi:hypothetical protein